MGLFDAIEKIGNTVNKVNKATNTIENTAKTANKVKGMADHAGKFLEKKCKICKVNPLKSDIEKQKGVCVTCAMARM